MKKGDYLFMEFGHNDQKQKGPGKGAFYSFVLIAGSANCVVSVFGVASGSRGEKTIGFSLGRVRADVCTVGVVAGADGSVLAGDCPSDRCSAGLAFPAGFSLTDVSSSRTDRFTCAW